jgi:outer membrane protein TolC
LEEVESSLVRYANDAQSLKHLTESVSSQHQNVDIQRLRTESGISDQLAVVEARATWFDARFGQVDQEVLLLTRLVNLYKALGGGWEQAEVIAMSSGPSEENGTK